MDHPAPIELFTPLVAPTTPPWTAHLILAGMLLAFAATLFWLAWRSRHLLLRGNRIAFATLLFLTPVMLKLAATKTGGANTNTTSSTGTTNLSSPGKQVVGSIQSPGSPTSPSSPTSLASTLSTIATQPAYSLEASSVATFTTNFFAGRLYPDPEVLPSRGGLHKTLSFAPLPNAQDEDYGTPLGTLLAVYGLPPDLQAVVAFVTLDDARSASRATLLRSPNLAVQQAVTHWDDPRASPGMLRFQPVGADRRMLVNSAETRLVPRAGWCVITVEAGSQNPLDLTLGTLGNDGSHSLGGAYWPGRVAEIVFIPREWQPDPESPPEPVPWNDTVRNALESYLLHKHRAVQPPYAILPPEYKITHDKVNLVESILHLPKIKIPGTLLIVR